MFLTPERSPWSHPWATTNRMTDKALAVGVAVGLPDTGKCGSDRIWCDYNNSLVSESLESPWGYSKLFDGTGLSCGNSHSTSLEPEPLEPTLVHNISQDGAGLRCGLNVYLTD
ncbi:hypothetical protein V6N13_058907 [Hibiscus sabdariffa]